MILTWSQLAVAPVVVGRRARGPGGDFSPVPRGLLLRQPEKKDKLRSRLYACLGYQNIPVNLDEALRQIGRYLYGVQHHERAQRVTHSLEALDEGSGTEGREQGR
jgi:hypothetical protein